MNKLFTGLFLAGFSIVAFAGTVEVKIEKMKFVPEEVHVKAGDTVMWKSYEKYGYHSVWFKSEGLPESDLMFLDESWQRKFDKKGEYPYRCGPHELMTGKIVVE